MTWKTGDLVWISSDDLRIAGVVQLASGNSASLMLGFNTILRGHAGSMPVLRDDAGVYRSIMDSLPVALERRE